MADPSGTKNNSELFDDANDNSDDDNVRDRNRCSSTGSSMKNTSTAVSSNSTTVGSRTDTNSASDTLTTTTNTTTATASTISRVTDTAIINTNLLHTAALTLPDGRIIDGKNTLQSFVVVDDAIDRGVVGVIAPLKQPPTTTSTPAATAATGIPNATPTPVIPAFQLPDGRLIDGKNTLQSFAVAADPPKISTRLNNKIPTSDEVSGLNSNDTIHPTNRGTNGTYIVSAVAIRSSDVDDTGRYGNGNNNSNNNNNNNNNINRDDTVHAEAVVARSLAVADAELFDSQLQQANAAASPPPQRSTAFWLAMTSTMILFGVIVGISVYCGTGNCGSSSSQSDDQTGSTPSPSPVSKGPTNPALPTSTNATNLPINSRLPTTRPLISPSTETPSIDPTNRSPVTNNTTNRPTNSPMDISSPTISPTIETPPIQFFTLQPIETPFDDQLMVACDFLSLTNVTVCRSATLFTGNPVGTTIPNEIGLLTQLTALRLGGEGLSGTIPSALGYLTQLVELTLFENQLTGTIPSTLGSLTMLTELSFSSNQLNGTIPVEFENLVQLNALWLYNNTQLTGAVPSSLCFSGDIYIGIDCDSIAIVCSCCSEGVNGTRC